MRKSSTLVEWRMDIPFFAPPGQAPAATVVGIPAASGPRLSCPAGLLVVWYLATFALPLPPTAAKVVEYLERADPEAARRAKLRYACFDRFGADTMACERGCSWWLMGRLGSKVHIMLSTHLPTSPRCLPLLSSPPCLASLPCPHSAWPDAYAVGVGGASSCADAAVSILKEVVRKASEYG